MSRAPKKDKDTQQNICDLLSLWYFASKQTNVKANISELIAIFHMYFLFNYLQRYFECFAIFYNSQSVILI